MNPAVFNFLLKLTAVGIQVQQSGLTDELRAELKALTDEATDSILEPQDNGEPWTPEAILAWKAEHDTLTSGIRDRHDGN